MRLEEGNVMLMLMLGVGRDCVMSVLLNYFRWTRMRCDR